MSNGRKTASEKHFDVKVVSADEHQRPIDKSGRVYQIQRKDSHIPTEFVQTCNLQPFMRRNKHATGSSVMRALFSGEPVNTCTPPCSDNIQQTQYVGMGQPVGGRGIGMQNGVGDYNGMMGQTNQYQPGRQPHGMVRSGQGGMGGNIFGQANPDQHGSDFAFGQNRMGDNTMGQMHHRQPGDNFALDNGSNFAFGQNRMGDDTMGQMHHRQPGDNFALDNSGGVENRFGQSSQLQYGADGKPEYINRGLLGLPINDARKDNEVETPGTGYSDIPDQQNAPVFTKNETTPEEHMLLYCSLAITLYWLFICLGFITVFILLVCFISCSCTGFFFVANSITFLVYMTIFDCDAILEQNWLDEWPSCMHAIMYRICCGHTNGTSDPIRPKPTHRDPGFHKDSNIEYHRDKDPNIEYHRDKDPNIEYHRDPDRYEEYHRDEDPNIEYYSDEDPNIEYHRDKDPNIEYHRDEDPNIEYHRAEDPNIEYHRDEDPNIEYHRDKDPNIEYHRDPERYEDIGVRQDNNYVSKYLDETDFINENRPRGAPSQHRPRRSQKVSNSNTNQWRCKKICEERGKYLEPCDKYYSYSNRENAPCKFYSESYLRCGK